MGFGPAHNTCGLWPSSGFIPKWLSGSRTSLDSPFFFFFFPILGLLEKLNKCLKARAQDLHSSVLAWPPLIPAAAGWALPCYVQAWASTHLFPLAGMCSLSRWTFPRPQAAQQRLLERERCAPLLRSALKLPPAGAHHPYRVRCRRHCAGCPTKCLPKATDNSLLITGGEKTQLPHSGFSLPRLS